MCIESPQDLKALRRIGRIVALTIQTMKKKLRPGITTGELDRIGHAVLEREGAQSAPSLLYSFPAATCISVNDEAAHGVPGQRIIAEGDLVNIDVSAELEGYFADAGQSIPVGRTSKTKKRLLRCAEGALEKALATIHPGVPLSAVGAIIEEQAHSQGFTVIRDLCGHGVGRHIHEEPAQILNFYSPLEKRIFTEGLVLTIEPFLSTGAEHIAEDGDGWTLRTTDGSPVAQFEHTIAVTHRGMEILTSL